MAERKPSRPVQDKISKSVEKMVHEWEETGKIKTSQATYRPRSKDKAIKQALAIEYGKHHVGRAGSRSEKS